MYFSVTAVRAARYPWDKELVNLAAPDAMRNHLRSLSCALSPPSPSSSPSAHAKIVRNKHTGSYSWHLTCYCSELVLCCKVKVKLGELTIVDSSDEVRVINHLVA